MTQRYAKTEAGRAEIKSTTHKLPRSARNLLLIIDGTRPASDWTQLIHGATAEDLKRLLAEGLIEPAQADAARGVRGAATLQQAIATLSYDQLYGLLTSQARDRLGLIKGFKMILQVEKCSGLPELQALAVRFVEMVRDAQGDSAARQMRLALGMAA
ncbi:MAG: hypothetical protein ACM3N6_03430 [Betaproteobacteria bacterium]